MSAIEKKAAAAHLVALHEEGRAMTRAFAQHENPTGVMADAILAKDRELRDACEAFRRRYCPRRYRVFVGLRGDILAASRTMRSVVTVYDGRGA